MILRTLIVSLAFFVIARGAAPTPDAERDQVRIAALRFMMTKHAEFGNERQSYSLYVLRDVRYVKHFAAFQPAVVPFEESRYPLSPGGAIDARTGKRVKIWSVSKETIEGGKATAGIKAAGAGHYTVFLEKKGDVWIVVSVRTDGIP